MPAIPPPALAVVVADGDVPSRAALDAGWPGWADGLAFTVGADGGARGAARLGLRLDALVGDFDSLAEAEVRAAEAAGVRIERHPVAKDESDLELAVATALERRPGRLVVLGAFGGRLDHELANLWLLAADELRDLGGRPGSLGPGALPEREDVGWPAAALLDARTRVSLLTGPARATFVGSPGDLVTLLPFAGPAQAVSTAGLAFPLRAEDLPVGPSRGLSNVRVEERSEVGLRAGRLLVVETHAVAGPPAVIGLATLEGSA